MKQDQNRFIFISSIILAILIIIVSMAGLFVTNLYSAETSNWKIQSVGQDKIDLFLVVPALLLAALLTYRKKPVAGLLWAGVMTYIVYTFIIYCFAVHFNRFFLLYCIVLGISFYSLGWFIYNKVTRNPATTPNSHKSRIITGIYFIVLSVLFYFLWLSEIIPATVNDTRPPVLADTGLLTNPVHVIDLSVFLPAVFLTGVLLIRKHPLASRLTVILLTFMVLMNITIGWLAFEMTQNGAGGDIAVSVAMAGLAALSGALLVWNLQ